MESTNRQLRALIKKNLVLKKRNIGITICELIFPIVLILIVGIIKKAFPPDILTNIMTDEEFLKTNSTMIINNKTAGIDTKYGLNELRTL